MESERDMEECGDTDDAIPSSSVSCNSKVESDSEEIDCVIDHIPLKLTFVLSTVTTQILLCIRFQVTT